MAGGELVGADTFEMDPGYAYWLGLWLWTFGESLWVPRVLGVLHGLLTVGAVAALTWEATAGLGAGADDDARRRRWTSAAALVTALCPLVLYYDLLVMKTSLMLALLPLSVWLLLRARRRQSPRALLLAGLVFALACTVRGNLLPLGALYVLAAVPLARLRDLFGTSWRRAAPRAAGLFLAGTLPVFALTAGHNLAASGELALLHTGGGEVFYLGTLDEGGGEYVKLPFVRPHPKLEHADFRREAERRAGTTLSRAEASRWWWREGLARVADAPLRYLKLELSKALMLLSAFEHPDSASFYFFSSLVTPLGLVGVFHFGLLMPFALAGLVLLVLARRERPVTMVPAAVAGAYLAAFLLFFVYSRFRVPVVGLLIPYAVGGALTLWEQRRDHPRRAAAWLVVLALSAVVLNRPGTADPQRELGVQYANYGAFYLESGQVPLAEELLHRGAELGDTDAGVSLGQLALARGQPERALERFQAALGIDPGHLGAQEGLLLAWLALGRRADVERVLASPTTAGWPPEVRAHVRRALDAAASTTAPPPPEPAPGSPR